eukprot:2725645-Prymnesium_polylepis.1
MPRRRPPRRARGSGAAPSSQQSQKVSISGHCTPDAPGCSRTAEKMTRCASHCFMIAVSLWYSLCFVTTPSCAQKSWERAQDEPRELGL